MTQKHRRIMFLATLFATALVASVLTLWSWNTIAELTGGPAAQFKHVIAAVVLLVFIRWTVATKPLIQRSFSHRKNSRPQ